MAKKIIPFGEALDRAADKLIVSKPALWSADDELALEYSMYGTVHVAKSIISMETANTPKGLQLFLCQWFPKDERGMGWIGVPVDVQPARPRAMTEAELREVWTLIENIYRRGK